MGRHVGAWKKKKWVMRCGAARGRKEGEKMGDETWCRALNEE